MGKNKTRKALDQAERRLQDAAAKLKRAQEKQDKAEAKADAKNSEVKPAQAKKLNAAIETQKKNVVKAQKALTRAQDKQARSVKTVDAPAEASTVDITGLDHRTAAAAIETALSDSSDVRVTGEARFIRDALILTLSDGADVRWEASLTADCPQAAVILQSATGPDSEGPPPVFCVAEGGTISNGTVDASAIEGDSVTVRIDGGTVRSLHGNGIQTRGSVEMLNGVIAAEGAAATAIESGTVELKGGLVMCRAADKAAAGNGELTAAAAVRPVQPDALDEGSCCVCVWVTSDGALPVEDGSEAGLVYWPEDACVWWDVAPDGVTGIYAGRNDQSNSVCIGSQTLPRPTNMRTAGNEVVSLSIIFNAKTETSDRPVLLDIQWGWDLVLAKPGAAQYNNHLAIAACALSDSVYHEAKITDLLTTLGFSEPVLRNYNSINITSAFALAHAHVKDAGTKKTVFAVVNRGSKTLMDWKGNVLDETIQNAQFFGQCADTVAHALNEYTAKYGQKDPANNIFFVTGHSLGAVVTDLLAAQHFEKYPAQNVFAYSFAAPLADPKTSVDDSRPIYNILNQNDVITSFPPRAGYKRVGSSNYTFSTKGKSARAMARAFRFLSHMNISALEHMSSFAGFFKKAIPSIMWNHSLTTYMAYLLAGGPDSIKESGGLWSVVQNLISAAGDIKS